MNAMNTVKTKAVSLSSLKPGDRFGIEGSNRHYQFNGAMQNAGWYGLEDLMTGRRYEWMGRVMVVKL